MVGWVSQLRVRRLPVAVALCVLLFLANEARVFGNGDPASHVLPSKEVFVPFDPSLCSYDGRRLDALTEVTARKGYPIKVAIIPDWGGGRHSLQAVRTPLRVCADAFPGATAGTFPARGPAAGLPPARTDAGNRGTQQSERRGGGGVEGVSDC
jgi:hypothetical protein